MQTTSRSKNLADLSILVVENPGDTGDLIEGILKALNSNTTFMARNSEHAYILHQAHKHDFIFVDLDIDPDGAILFAKKIRAIKEGGAESSQTPIVLMTSFAPPKTIEAAKQAGINELLIKPFAFDDIINCINHLMGKYSPNLHKKNMKEVRHA